ncbi:MAG: hypothetical protein MK101_05345 [Phycisphaerales bacterium]|nr:hypothetical protein [Phycisphaerales bacterium]
MRTPPAFWLCMPLLAAMGFACTSEPRVSLATTGVLTQISDEAIAGEVQVNIRNTGSLEIELLEYHYSVQSGDRGWTGRHAGELVLSPGIDREATLPIVVRAPAGGWPGGAPPQSLPCSLSGSLVYIGNGVFDETLAELGYRPSAPFGGHVTLDRPAEASAESD